MDVSGRYCLVLAIIDRILDVLTKLEKDRLLTKTAKLVSITRNGNTDGSRIQPSTRETTRSGCAVWLNDPAVERDFVMYRVPCKFVFPMILFISRFRADNIPFAFKEEKYLLHFVLLKPVSFTRSGK